MHRLRTLVLMAGTIAILGLVTAGTPAPARDRACAADVKKFCQGVPAGQRQGCLTEHAAELSAPCRANIQAAQQQAQALRQACQGEVAQFCQGVSPGGPLRQCLQQHEADVSPECKSALTERPQRRPAR
jgi:hypothetical protein